MKVKQRWYQGYKSRMNPVNLIEQISKKVREEELSLEIPLLRIEKGAKPKKEYYFFIAIESDRPGKLPDSVLTSDLLKLPAFNKPAPRGMSVFTYDQIKGMVGVSHEVTDYTNPISYRQPEKILYDDPFEPLGFDINDLSLDSHKTKPDERLVYWLSATGRGTWDSFRKICHNLSIPNPKGMMRKLKLLGYIEMSSDGKKWSVTPTALVKVDNNDDREFFICGQYNYKLLEILKSSTLVVDYFQPLDQFPPCHRIDLDPVGDFKTLYDRIFQETEVQIQKVDRVAQNLAEKLPNLEQWENQLNTVSGFSPELYDWQVFKDTDFWDCPIPRETGLYRLATERSSSPVQMTLFYNDRTQTWKRGDWYGLRFLTLARQGMSTIARYQPSQSKLAIPFSQRWPEIYERALVLSSGLLPNYKKTESGLWLMYEDISPSLASNLCQKLTVNLIQGE